MEKRINFELEEREPAATRDIPQEKLFIKISQYSLGYTCVGVYDLTLFRKKLQHRCFPVNIAKFLRTPVLKNICKRLFLKKPIFTKQHSECFGTKLLRKV